MRHFYDLEFLEDGRTIDLISIGIVAEDGRELYLVNGDANWRRIGQHPWLMRHVVPSLPASMQPEIGLVPRPGDVLTVDWSDPEVDSHRGIAESVRAFLLAGDEPELWADYGAYDHVRLMQLWGPMIDKPAGLPMYTNDIQQERRRLGNPAMPEQAAGHHNALADARHNRDQWEFLHAYAQPVCSDLRVEERPGGETDTWVCTRPAGHYPDTAHGVEVARTVATWNDADLVSW